MTRALLQACALALALGSGKAMAQQSFTCSWGKDAACLDYGDTVCSSRGKCVDRNAACFDSYQCDYQGFACKSDLVDCARAHDEILAKHNELVDQYNTLLEDARKLAADLDNEHRHLTDLQDCIEFASSLEEAQSCP